MGVMENAKKNLVDAIEYCTSWGIKRFKSERHNEDCVVYRKEEALEAFGVPQHTIICGGVGGIMLNSPVVFEKIRNGALKTKQGFIDIVATICRLNKGNILLNEGINELFTILCSAASGTKFDNTNARLGVGDSATAEAATQTGLQAATNKYYQAMDGGYPTYGTNQKGTWRATFASGNGNFDWREFTVANGSSDSAVNLNRKVSSQGTKASGQSWELTLEISLS